MNTILKLAGCIAVSIIFQACKNENLKTVTSTTIDNYNIVVLSDNGSIKSGIGKFYLEFQNAGNNQPLDAGNVKVQANMPMPGMPMTNDGDVTKTDKTGRYAVKYDLGMAGTWTLNVRFDNNRFASTPLTVQ